MGFDDIQREIQNLRGHWKDSLDELHLLFAIAKEIAFTRDLNVLLDQVVSRTAQVMQSEAATLFLLNPDTHQLEFCIVKGQHSAAIRHLNIHLNLGEGVAGWVASNQQYAICNDVRTDSRFKRDVDDKTGFQTKNLLAVPLKSSLRSMGVIEVVNKEGGFTDKDAAFLDAMGWLVARALENAQENQKTKATLEFNRSIIANLPGGLIGVDLDGKITQFNARAKEIFGSIPIAIGKKYAECFLAVPPFCKIIEETLSSRKETKRKSFDAIIPGRNRRFIGYSTLFIKGEGGETTGCGVMFQDITDFSNVLEDV